MTTLNLDLDTVAALRSLQALKQAASELKPLYLAIGESLQDSTIDRFASSTAPDGSKWLPNTQVTFLRYLAKFSTSYTKKTGKLSSTGANRAINKKPLVGESKSLSTTIRYQLNADGVSIGSNQIYAATQQFGAAARSFKGGKTPWGDIPARPFLGLSGDDEKSITELALEHLQQALNR